MDTPQVLYHGSLYKQNELMPGFKRSGELTVWDGVETNQSLYATTDKTSAALLGLGSATEKEFETNRFTVAEKDIFVFANQQIDIGDILGLVIYRYTIPFRPQDGWVKNDNPYNNIDTEWKTPKTIHGVKVEQLNLKDVLNGRRVIVTTAPVDVALPVLTKQYASETKIYQF
jgi:hypothetical protein